jgi:hypothetical protein
MNNVVGMLIVAVISVQEEGGAVWRSQRCHRVQLQHRSRHLQYFAHLYKYQHHYRHPLPIRHVESFYNFVMTMQNAAANTVVATYVFEKYAFQMPKHAIQMMNAVAANATMASVRQLFVSLQIQVQAIHVHPLKLVVELVPRVVAKTVYLIQGFVGDVSVSPLPLLANHIGNAVLVVVDNKPMYALKQYGSIQT